MKKFVNSSPMRTVKSQPSTTTNDIEKIDMLSEFENAENNNNDDKISFPNSGFKNIKDADNKVKVFKAF